MNVISFVEVVGKTKAGEPSVRTHKLWWAICDVCGEGTWTSNLQREPCASCGASLCNRKAICCEECRHPVGLACRMTPRCGGRHRKEET
jgi:hypothetical protein